MAMNGDDLGDQITDTILALAEPDILTPGEEGTIRTFWKAIATDITDHIDTQAQILSGTFVAGGFPVNGQGDIK
jgi:hypothetical protein